MPIEYAPHTTPQGRRVLRSVSRGVLTAHDAQALRIATAPGGPYHGLPLLALSEKDTEFTAESRKVFVEFGGGPPVVAIVVASTATRVMLNFIVKAGQTLNAPTNQGTEARFFSTEAEAASWLDERLAAAGPS